MFKEKIGIEIDGGYHETKEQKEADDYRSEILNKQGIRIIRFTNEEVLKNIETVTQKIKHALNKKDL